MASTAKPEVTEIAHNLAELAARQDLPESQRWMQAVVLAQTLADCLRTRNETDEHSALGRTPLPRTLNSFLTEALGGPGLPSTQAVEAVYELLRVAANFCMDHDDNRGLLLTAHFPHTVVSLLERYSNLPKTPGKPLGVALTHLKTLKVAAGFLLNASLSFDPVRDNLLKNGAPKILVDLRARVYPPCSWAVVQTDEVDLTGLKEEWDWRRGFTDWTSMALSELLRDDLHRGVTSSTLSTSSLTPVTDVIASFVPPYPTTFGPFIHQPTLRHSFITTDVDVLTDACSILEALALDSDKVPEFIAKTVDADSSGDATPLLRRLVDFVELGDYPPYWSSGPVSETDKWKKSFDMCKAAVIRAVVEVAGSPSSLDLVWDLTRPDGWFVTRMINWVKANANGDRDDLVICGTLCLGNLARRESHCAALVQPPTSLVPELVSLLDASTDIKLKHGALGLIKHLSQTASSQSSLTEANVVERLVQSHLWSEKVDMAETVQLLGIGAAKHLCASSPLNAIKLVLSRADDTPTSPTGLDQILSLVKRSDTIAVKSEGTRTVYQVIRSICIQNQSSSVDEDQRREAINILTASSSAIALAELAHRGRAKPYVILINEAIGGLTLLSLQTSGAALVAQTLLASLPPLPVPSSSRSTSQSSQSSPVSPSTCIELLHEIILQESISGEKISPELRVNACLLLGGAGRKDAGGKESEDIREKSEDVLSSIADDSTVDERIRVGAKKALDMWK